MRKAVPEDQKDDFVQRKNSPPVDVKIFTYLHYDKDDVLFRAIPNYGGTPWFDYGFIDINPGHPVAEKDPMY